MGAAKKRETYNYKLTKMDAAKVDAAVEREKIEVEGDLAEKAHALQAHLLGKVPEAEMAECDVCSAISAGTDKECPFCGAGGAVDDAPAVTAISRAEAKSQRDMQENIDKVRLLRAEGGRNLFEIGRTVKELYDKGLWKHRLSANGSPLYRNFKLFCPAEYGLSSRSCFDLMDVVSNFEQKLVESHGPSKLALVLRLPAKEREDFLKKGADLSYRKIREQVQEQTSGARRTTGRDKSPWHRPDLKPKVKAPKPKRMTIAQIEGKKEVLLWAKTAPKAKIGDPPKAAKRMTDVPMGHLDLANDVKMTFQMSETSTGQWRIMVAVKRTDAKKVAKDTDAA